MTTLIKWHKFHFRLNQDNSNEASLQQLEIFEKVILYLHKQDCIYFRDTDKKDTIKICEYASENGQIQSFDKFMEILERNKSKKFIVLSELSNFKKRGYITAEQKEIEDQKIDREKAQKRTFWVSVVAIAFSGLSLIATIAFNCIFLNTTTKIEIVNPVPENKPPNIYTLHKITEDSTVVKKSIPPKETVSNNSSINKNKKQDKKPVN